jgi:hypothetical protein
MECVSVLESSSINCCILQPREGAAWHLQLLGHALVIVPYWKWAERVQ